jgi:hypothetical protein
MKAILFVLACLAVSVYGQGEAGELARLPFGALIGGPLQAVVKAQAKAARTTIEFINNVGFSTDAQGVKTVEMVTFSYDKVDNGTERNFEMSVPFLLMVPIPYIEIRSITIDFNVQLNSARSQSSSSSHSFGVQASGGWSFWGAGVSWSAGYSMKAQSAQSGTVNRDYKLHVRVEAGQADLPKGTSRILDIFEGVIQDGLLS